MNAFRNVFSDPLISSTNGSFNGYFWRSMCLGTNSFDVNVMDWVSATFLNAEGLLPLWALIVPALVGAAVVGSVERRIARFLKHRKQA